MLSLKRLYNQFKILYYQYASRHLTLLLILLACFLVSHFNLFDGIKLSNTNPAELLSFFTIVAVITHSLDVFSKLRGNKSGIYYLMTPATIAEKYTVSFIYSTIVTILVYLVAFNLVHLLIISIHNLFNTYYDAPYHFTSQTDLLKMLRLILFLQPLYFLGSVLFHKNPFLKTSAITVGFFIVLSIVIGMIISHYTAADNTYVSLRMNHPAGFDIMDGLKQFKELKTLYHTLQTAFWVIPFICWIASYFRLKTIQV
jgi:hypothetical protein